MDSSNNKRRGDGHRPTFNPTVADCAQNYGLSDNPLIAGIAVQTGRAAGYEAPVLSKQDVLEVRRDLMSTGQIGASESRNANALPRETGTGYNVDISLLESFHKFFSEDKWEVQPLHGERTSDKPSYSIVPGVHGTGSEAETCSEITQNLRGTQSTSKFSDVLGQGHASQLELLGLEVMLESGNVTNLIPTHRMSIQPLPLTNLQPVTSINLIIDHAAETQVQTPSGKPPELDFTDDSISGSGTSTNLADQSPEALLIYNRHAHQWQDKLILFNHHQARAQEDLINMTEVRGLLTDPSEHTPVKSRSHEVHQSCGKTLPNISVTKEIFRFWPDESLFHACPTSPSFWSGSHPVRQFYANSYPYTTNTTQTLETVDSPQLTPAPRYPNKNNDSAAGNHEVEGEACDSSDNWMESRGDPTHSMSRRGDAGSARVHVDKSFTICQGISAEQETTEMRQTVFAASLELPQAQDKSECGDSALELPCLQEHADDQLPPNSKRERTNSIEMLSKPTSALRKKKQKDEEIPEGRLRGTSICTDPNLYYGLAAVQNLLMDFHICAGFCLEAKNLSNQRPKVADLLDAELEALCIGDSLSPEVKGAVFAVLKLGRGYQLRTANLDLVEHIVDLKTRLVSLLEESRSHESSTLSQLKDTVSRYSFLFPTSATDAFTKRLVQSNQHTKLEDIVCQYLREIKIFTGPSPSSASSSSGHRGIQYTSEEPIEPSAYLTARGQIMIEALGERSASTLPTVARSEKPRVTSRRDLSGARGNLPKVAAEFMRKWLFDNFDNPNPSREIKLLIATKFNITEKQVTNHFVNLRARKYRPLLRSLQEEPRTENGDEKQNHQCEDKDGSETPTRKLRKQVE